MTNITPQWPPIYRINWLQHLSHILSRVIQKHLCISKIFLTWSFTLALKLSQNNSTHVSAPWTSPFMFNKYFCNLRHYWSINPCILLEKDFTYCIPYVLIFLEILLPVSLQTISTKILAFITLSCINNHVNSELSLPQSTTWLRNMDVIIVILVKVISWLTKKRKGTWYIL